MVVERKEQKLLEEGLADPKIHTICLTGPFGSGKTTIGKSIPGALYFSCLPVTEERSLKALSALIVPRTGYPSRYVFHSAEEAVTCLAAESDQEGNVLVLDDAENLLSDKDLGEIPKALTGSSLRLVLISERPCKSADLTISLSGFSFSEAEAYLSDMDEEDRIKTLSFFGFSPYVLHFIDQKAGFEENVNRLAGNDGMISLLPDYLMQRKLRETKVYNGILLAMAEGRATPTLIGRDLNLSANVVSRYLQTLVDEGFVRKEALYGTERKVSYRIAIPLLDWHFRNLFGKADPMEQVKRNRKDTALAFVRDREQLSVPFRPFAAEDAGVSLTTDGVSKSTEKLVLVNVIDGEAKKSDVETLYLASRQAQLAGSRSSALYLFCEGAEEEAMALAKTCVVNLYFLDSFCPLEAKARD
jgi:predicted transcriptional regulator